MSLPKFSCSRLPYMRIVARLVALFSLAGLSLLCGCWVVSVNGIDAGTLFHPDPDRIFDGGLLGSWTTENLTCTIILNVKAEGNGYAWEKRSFGEKCPDKGKTLYSQAEMFQLGASRFLDVTARQSDVCEMCLPVHWIFRLEMGHESIALMPIDADWLKQAKESKSVSLATVSDDPNTITASPAELKAFCREHSSDRHVFMTVSNLTFKRKYVDHP